MTSEYCPLASHFDDAGYLDALAKAVEQEDGRVPANEIGGHAVENLAQHLNEIQDRSNTTQQFVEEPDAVFLVKAEQEYLAPLAGERDAAEYPGLVERLVAARKLENERAKFPRNRNGAVNRPAPYGGSEPVGISGPKADWDSIALQRKRGAVIIPTQEGSGIADIVLLPTCDPRWLPAPEAIVRGSLFGLGTHRNVKISMDGKLVRKKERISFSKQRKSCGVAGNANLHYRGPALDQGDFDVWIHLLELARENLSVPIAFRISAFLTKSGRNNGGRDYKLLIESLERLAEGSFSVTRSTIPDGLSIALVREVLIDTETKIAKVTLDPKIAALFGTEKHLSWTKLQRQQRQALVGKEAALWLHAFYSSHAKPIPLRLAYLQDSCGTNAGLSEFRRVLAGAPKLRGTAQGSGALDQLVKVGFLKEWKIEGDVVKVVRDQANLSVGQSRFLNVATTAVAW